MEENIVRATTDAINNILKLSFWESLYLNKETLVHIPDLLNQLLIEQKWSRLFCRQLQRLMNSNDSLSEYFWIHVYEDILCALNKSKRVETMNGFLKRMNFEAELEQRELDNQQIVGERKCLSEFISEHQQFFERYFQKCLEFHSKIQIQGLIENHDCHQKTFKSIDIPLDCSNRSMTSIDTIFHNDIRNFVPSQQVNINVGNTVETIENVLGSNRWVVILGDPGSAKTTLLRWITRTFIEAINRGEEMIDNQLPIRIPILIRIGEFASWLNQQQQKRTLFDYIGEHTWFSQCYCDEGENVLKTLLYHSHALILLDGLDEIIASDRRSEIIELVRDFIDKYIRAPDYISAFDDTSSFCYDGINETQSPRKSAGNQIVITSRLVGYQFYPVHSPFIKHYSLLLMNRYEASEFIKNWVTHVQKSMLDVFRNEINIEKLNQSCNRVYTIGQSLLEDSSEPLKSNPSLLSLICTLVFQSSIEYHLKSRIQVYSLAVQAACNAWQKQNSNVLESDLMEFLTDLAMYLHKQSSSGLIDAFDLENLCRVTLIKQQNRIETRAKQREYAKKIIGFLESNNVIVSERGLQTFGFLHLSFQEYFVAQALLKDISHERIISFALNPRFRESLLLVLSWISWQWSFDKYDEFCRCLFNQIDKSFIPLGVFLFFEAINDIYRLPSDSVIFLALNNLLNHSSDTMRRIYMISNLSKLPENTIINWMNTYLNDDACLLKFCQCFPTIGKNLHELTPRDRKEISPIIYQRLWSFHSRSSLIEYLIDKTLQKTLLSVEISHQIFNKNFSFTSNIHPLKLSTIAALCGGIYLKYNANTIEVDFSSNYMHRECSIIKYLENINQLRNELEHISITDTSVRTIDLFIALICLQGVSQPLIYQKYSDYKALPLAIERFKHIWFYLKELRQPLRTNSYTSSETHVHRAVIDPIIDIFYCQSKKSFPRLCDIALKMLGFWNFDEYGWNYFEIFRRNKIGRYIHYHPHIAQFIPKEKLIQLSENIYSREMIQNEPIFLLMFLSQSLQLLYYCTIIAPINPSDSLPLVVLLAECLTYFEDIDKERLTLFLALPKWQSLFDACMLENYALAHFYEEFSNRQIIRIYVNDFLETLDDPHVFDTVQSKEPDDWQTLIDIERQRISKSNSNAQLFAAVISLARLFQAKFRCKKIKNICLSSVESNEVYSAMANISDIILQILAWNTILDMKNPLIFNIKQTDQLRSEMINLLQTLLPNLPLLTSTILFIRCHKLQYIFPESFQTMTKIIISKFQENLQCREDEVALIALQQLDRSVFSKIAKQKQNLSELLLFNSTVFHRYFLDGDSFESCNPIVLASMYLTELAFDAQIINIYMDANPSTNKTPFKQLWHNSFHYAKILTKHISSWIGDNLHRLKKSEIQQIVEDLSKCSMIDKGALPIIEKWLDYRMNTCFKFFAHFSALNLIIHGSNSADLLEIFEEILHIDREFRFKSMIERLITSSLINFDFLHEILFRLHRNVYYFSKISILIDRQETLEIILKLELERIILKNIQMSSFTLLIKDFSEQVQIYLLGHIQQFISTNNEIVVEIKGKYVAAVIKLIIESSLRINSTIRFCEELYDFTLELLHDQRFPLVQKTILNSIYLVSIGYHENEENIFLQEKTIVNLERMINSWNMYSKDLIAECLLAYRCCLFRLKRYRKVRYVYGETKNILENLSQSSLRAKICLIFAEEDLDGNIRNITNYLSNKWKMTLIDQYRLLVEFILGNERGEKSVMKENERKVTELLDMHCDELMNTFVMDLYNYLCSNDVTNSMPDFIGIATVLIEKKSKEFCNAIRNSYLEEKDFKMELCRYYNRDPKSRKAILAIYTIFGVVTDELVDMLERIDDDNDDQVRTVHIHEKQLTEVSDQNVIVHLFRVIDSTTSQNHLTYYLNILISLAQVGVISLLEVHENIVPIKNISYDYGTRIFNKERHILRLLTNVSCFEVVTPNFEDFSIEPDIDEEFEKEALDAVCFPLSLPLK